MTQQTPTGRRRGATPAGRRVIVRPPRLVPMTDQDQQQALEALVALLIPYIRSQHNRDQHQQPLPA